MSDSSELDPGGTRAVLDEASHAPGAIYAGPEIFRREVDECFKRERLYVGRVEELADPGDFMALRLIGEDGAIAGTESLVALAAELQPVVV